MSEMSNSIKETIDRLWERGRNSGMSDSEIIDMIEAAMRERVRTQGRTPRKKYNYTPMTDEEILQAQQNIGTYEQQVEEVYVAPQVLYGPPPQQVVEEVYIAPQVLYGPPPRSELEEMMIEPDPQPTEGNNHRK